VPNCIIRKLQQPDDFAAVAPLLNLIWSQPTTAEQLNEDEDKIPPGKLHYNEEGQLMGWDRPKWVAEDEHGQIVAYAIAWRAPWTEPGALIYTLVVDPKIRGNGVGNALYDTLHQWAAEVKASRLIGFMKENDERSLAFAERRNHVKERHSFESVQRAPFVYTHLSQNGLEGMPNHISPANDSDQHASFQNR
jgi:GNAT superfamily N-acetyltransferase